MHAKHKQTNKQKTVRISSQVVSVVDSEGEPGGEGRKRGKGRGDPWGEEGRGNPGGEETLEEGCPCPPFPSDPWL